MKVPKKGKKIMAGVASVFAAATIAFFGLNVDTTTEIEYKLVEGDKVTELSITPPEDAKVDIAELYCNESLVTKTALPDGKLKSLPLIFSDLDNLELRFYKLGEFAGVGTFKENKLYGAFKDGVIENEK